MRKEHTRTGGLFKVVGFCMIFAAATVLNANAQTRQAVELIDGRDASAPAPLTVEETRFIVKEVRRQEPVIRQISGLDCEEDETSSLSVGSVIKGSFTKPNAEQKAYLYELCRSGRAFGIGGIVVVEDGRVAAHYVYGENGLDSDIAALPDINRNGFSEIMMVGGGNGQGYTQGAVEIIEFTPGGVHTFGIADTYEDNFGTEGGKKSARAFKVSVLPGKSPVFFREGYVRNGEQGKWTQTVKSEKFRLRLDYEPKWHKIS
ncbi:MAG TPA: hypothetical protein VIL74_12590 [Pyrinomonadaceae bacterium]|jgi:hypothetical protein